MSDRRELEASYDAVAEEYARRIADELRDKPLDRELLDRFAAAIRGPVCDVGCGPGHVARYLHDRGIDVTGFDLSAQMVACARRLHPGIPFEQGDMTRLDASDGTWAGIVSFYSIIHVDRSDLVPALREWHRVLRPRGVLLLAFHVGGETMHLDEWWGHRVSADFHFFEPQEMTAALHTAGFAVRDVTLREPYPEVEHPTRRAYIESERD